MVKALIIGAGAIGRGFLPWCLDSQSEITFIDANDTLIDALSKQGSYLSFMSHEGQLMEKSVVARFVSTKNSDFIVPSAYDICFIAVGPRNIENLPGFLSELTCPIFSLENDSKTVPRIKEKYDIENVFFGVPDVITSCTASPNNLSRDKFSLHTEHGTLYLNQAGATDVICNLDNVTWASELDMIREWDAKLYIHNTPHCIAAYLGSLQECKYVHEALALPEIYKVVNGVIIEMVDCLRKVTDHDPEMLLNYANKEIQRFADLNLYDPIYRVARHPLRKLRPFPNGRLVGALSLCLSSNSAYENLLIGISAALRYKNPLDDDNSNMELIEFFGIRQFLWHYLGIEPNQLVSDVITSAYESIKS
ncbi:hypothetical protein U9R62_10530 [Cylindrospermopsis raciborskii DSH]|uniref:mannitol dehydrogenase family protein n=1 Tax=Cylindrospermopsis raciborskii TaxID=77022 RepID=UPI002EDB9FBE